MKFNLKNRPDTGDALAKAVFDDWFEGFEKELREIQKRKNYGELGSYWDVPQLLKEILGE